MNRNSVPVSEYVLRFFSYLLSRIIVYGLIVIVIILAFFAGLNYMNISVLLKDGMYKRAAVIIMDDDPAILVKVFSSEFLEKDPLLYSNLYDDYVVRSINHQASTDLKLILPWEDETDVYFTEQILYIDGELPADYSGAEKDPEPPQWIDGRYRVHLEKTDGSWRITEMELLEILPKPDIVERALATPSPSPTAAPSPSQ